MKIKYVIIDGMSAVLLPDTLQHSDMDRVGKITGAGFCAFYEVDGEWVVDVFGKSVSCDIESKWEDINIIKLLLG